MAWEEDIQKVKGIFGDISGLIETRADIFGQAKEVFYPAWSQSPPAPVKTAEPIAIKPIVAGAPLSLQNPLVIVGLIVIGYLWLKKS